MFNVLMRPFDSNSTVLTDLTVMTVYRIDFLHEYLPFLASAAHLNLPSSLTSPSSASICALIMTGLSRAGKQPCRQYRSTALRSSRITPSAVFSAEKTISSLPVMEQPQRFFLGRLHRQRVLTSSTYTTGGQGLFVGNYSRIWLAIEVSRGKFVHVFLESHPPHLWSLPGHSREKKIDTQLRRYVATTPWTSPPWPLRPHLHQPLCTQPHRQARSGGQVHWRERPYSPWGKLSCEAPSTLLF